MKLQIGVKALIKNNKGSCLFLKRSQPLLDGTGIKWDVPGGRIDPAEDLFTALRREINEETGLRLESEPKLVKAQDIFLRDKDLHVVRLTYVVNLDGEAELSDEHTKFKWVPINDMYKLDMDSYLREVVEDLPEKYNRVFW